MGLDVPDLDDREFEALLEDARSRIPVHSETWTDHNTHDPGITILEVLTWQATTHAFQLDQITDTHRRKYLELVDVEPRAPQQATVLLSLSLPKTDPNPSTPGTPPGELDDRSYLDNLDGTTIPAHTELATETPSGDNERFRTTEPVTLSTAAVTAVAVAHEDIVTEHTRATKNDGLHFQAFGDDPAVDDALYLGFDTNPFGTGALNLWFDYHHANLPTPARHGDEDPTFEPSLRCVWEHCERPADWRSDDAWTAIDPDRDDTNALYRGGRVTLPRPSGWRNAPTSIAQFDDRYWVRCRLAPLDVDDPPEPRYEVPPQLNAIEVNVVEAVHETIIEDERLTTPDGTEQTSARPNQRFVCESAPVQSASVTVGGESWTVVPDFDESTADDTHVVLDEASGTLRFGDGRSGAIPQPRLPVDADYVAGGGLAGNLPARTEWQFVGSAYDRLDVTPIEPPSGGREAESIDSALARAREQRTVPFRAVTADDHAYIATHTPGLRFGRAAVAATPEGGGPVTVVVVPYSPDGRRPVPSEGFREAVETHVCRHALLTEQVRVVGPTFVPVRLSVEVEPVPSAAPERVRERARAVLEAFLDPLDGFEGIGWPFGRPIYPSELYEQLETEPQIEDAVDIDISTSSDVAMGDRNDTLPSLVGVDVELHSDDDRCGRWS